MVRDDQIRIPVAYVRGGSSKAVFLREHDVPPPGSARDKVLKRIMGTPDPIQIDGMGGAKAVTSKMAIIAPSIRSDAEIDYTFVQTGVRDELIDYNANCGNISSGVGSFAIDEGLVKNFRPGRSFDGKMRTQEVRIYNTGTKKIIISHVPIDENGFSVAKGDFQMAAVPGSGAPILMDYRETIGAALNRGLLPTGNAIDRVEVAGKSVDCTICDVANIDVIAYAADFGIAGHESAEELTSNAELVARAKELRGKAAQLAGMCKDWEKVDEQSPFVPMVIFIGAPPSSNGKQTSHLSARLFLDNMCHPSMAGTGSMCLAACSRIKGSAAFRQIGEAAAKERVLNITHPLGIMPTTVETTNPAASSEPSFSTLSFVRTSRRLMDGHVYVPKDILVGEDDAWSISHANAHASREDQPNGHGSPNGELNAATNGLTASKPGSKSTEDVPVTRILAGFISNADPNLLSTQLRDRLKEYLIDYIGVTVAAADSSESTESICNAIIALGGANGSSTVIGKGKSFTPQYAGLLNATFGHSLDFDDTYAKGSLHAGVSAISAGLTQAELLGDAVDSDHFLVAVAVGYEIICRLGKELGNEAYSRGFHNTSTTGIFGAIATIAVLKRLSTSMIESAFGLAGSKAAGSMQYLENGSWNKRLHPGFAVHDAFVCVALAEAGVVGAAKSLEGKFGFLHAYSPKKHKDLDYLTGELGSRWVFLETALKPFPACRMTHGLIEVAARMGYETNTSSNGEVKSITLSFSPANLDIVGARTSNKLNPQNMVDAQFSAYFQTSHSWLYGSNSGMRCYERLGDTQINDLSQKITCVADSNIRDMGSKMKVEYADGKVEEEDIPFPLGEPEHPFTREQVDAKFFALVKPVLGHARATKIRDAVDNIETQTISRILGMLV